MLNSPIQNGTQPDGKCIVFQFAINGPNSEQLSLFMQPTGPGSNDTLTVGQPKDTLWKSRGAVQQEWQTAAILYSFGQPHQVLNDSPRSNKAMNESTVSLSHCCPPWPSVQLIFQASAGDQKPPHRRMQGHIVLDNIDLGPENVNEPPVINLCVGHCNFDGGLCGWTNDAQHDFNWKLVPDRLMMVFHWFQLKDGDFNWRDEEVLTGQRDLPGTTRRLVPVTLHAVTFSSIPVTLAGRGTKPNWCPLKCNRLVCNQFVRRIQRLLRMELTRGSLVNRCRSTFMSWILDPHVR